MCSSCYIKCVCHDVFIPDSFSRDTLNNPSLERKPSHKPCFIQWPWSSSWENEQTFSRIVPYPAQYFTQGLLRENPGLQTSSEILGMFTCEMIIFVSKKQGKCPVNNYPNVHFFCETQVTWLRVRCSSGYLDKPYPSAPTKFHSIEGKQRSPSPTTQFLCSSSLQQATRTLVSTICPRLAYEWPCWQALDSLVCHLSLGLSVILHTTIFLLNASPPASSVNLLPVRSFLSDPVLSSWFIVRVLSHLYLYDPVLCDDIQPVLKIKAQSPKCLFYITMLCLICPSILP